MQLKPSFVLLATLASAGTISALPVDGTTGASERRTGDIDARAPDIGVDWAVSMGFDRQSRGFYEELDARDVLEEFQPRNFDDLEIREPDYLEELEARAQPKISKIPKPKPPPRPVSTKRRARIPKPGPRSETNPSISIDPRQPLYPNKKLQEGRAPRGGKPRPGPKPAQKPGTPDRQGIEIFPGVGFPVDPFQIIGELTHPASVQRRTKDVPKIKQPVEGVPFVGSDPIAVPGHLPAIMIPRRAGGGRKVAPKPGPKPGPTPAPKSPGGGFHVNPPTIAIEPVIPLPPLFPPAPPAPTSSAAPTSGAAPTPTA